MTTLSDVLDDDLLLALAGDRYFQRGVGYFEQGRVHSLAQYEERITAEVHGTETYQVQLWLQDGDLLSRCNCPLGTEGAFCKHCVAVGLAWIAEPPSYRPAEAAPANVGTTMEDVRDYLARQERELLVRMILDRAMEDARWREQLLMKAASQQTGGADITTFRRALRNAIPIEDFVDYYAAADYADDVQSAIDGLEDLLDLGYASDVIELSEEAIELLEDALNAIDDSNSYMSPIMEQVQELHYCACETAQPDLKALAERLFHRELSSGYGFFYNAIENYADILGEEGRSAYQHLVDAEWKKLPEVGKEERTSFNYRRSMLNRMKENLVAATGDLEELVTVISKDLSSPSRYLQIAQLYHEASEPNEAIVWAEKGLAEFEDYFTGQLGDFLIAAYEQQDRFEDAIAVVWQDFSRSPSLHLYQKLQQQADKDRDWSTWRERALEHISQLSQPPTSTKRSSSPRCVMPMRNTLLVEIFLWEGDVEQAWQAAQAGDCVRRLWMQLAELRAADYPEDALSVYQPAIEPLINKTNNQAYSQAVDLIEKVKIIMVRLDKEAEFKQLLEQLSKTYKRKRNFIKLLIQRNLI
ncbi:MAG: DUF6880 family protein [Cyanobacteria bacterium J06555_13]